MREGTPVKQHEDILKNHNDEAHVNTINLLTGANKCILDSRANRHDYWLAPLVYGAYLCYLAGKTISPSYKESLSPLVMTSGSIVHVDLIPLTEICLGDMQYDMLVCDEFSIYLNSILLL